MIILKPLAVRASIFVALIILSPQLLAQYTSNFQFGYQGQDGRNGTSSRSGTDGASVTVFAQEGARALDLSGRSGAAGTDGSYGHNASSCYQSLAHHDMQGARGGDGGNGGNGSRGGDGGDAIVYFSDYQELKDIFIDATPGEGMPGGRGADGGRPCYCSQHYWRHLYTETRYRNETYQDCSIRRICRREGDREVCRNERVCQTRTRRVPYTYTFYRDYRCFDGRIGRRGMDGQYGGRGEWGQLTLVKSDQLLGAVSPSRSVPLANLEGSYHLSNHRWSNRTGANGLLAPGSKVRDSYRFWEGKTEHRVELVWAVPGKDPSDFGQGNIHLQLTGEQVVATFPSHFLHQKEIQTRDGVTTITITQAVLESDVKRIFAREITGSMKDTQLVIEDDAQVSDLVSTRFFIKAKWRKASDKKFYQQWVPADFVEQDGHEFRINVGQFDLKARRFLFFKRRQYFKVGAKVKLELMIERRFAGRTIMLPLSEFKQKIPKHR